MASTEPAATEAMTNNEPTKAPENDEATQPAVGAPPPQAGAGGYTVLVGAEDVDQGAQIEAFFPTTLHVHVGDTVTWKQNAAEIHTVNFLAGQQTPPFVVPLPNGPQGAVMINPVAAFPNVPQNGQYDGSSPAGSGVMGQDQGQAPNFNLTFTKAGTYNFICLVHSGMKMVGTIIVDPAGTSIPSPAQVSVQAQQEIAQALQQVPAVIANAQKLIVPDVKNADGTTTHTVMVGYAEGQVDLMSFFPATTAVKPGDTVTWNFSPQDMAPHTITFLNGADEPPTIKAIPQPSGPPILTFDPLVAQPQGAGQPLTNQGMYSSGVIDPSAPGPHTYSIKIGNLQSEAEYVCLLHDSEGMKGTLTVGQ
jgi:plastocyanin